MVCATIREHAGVLNVENGTLNGTLNYTLNGTLNDILIRLNPTQKRVYDYVCANHGVQAKTIVAELDIKRDTLNKVFKTLTDLGLIVHKDSKKTGGYYPVKK
jgi:predicted transcriptional regulator